MPTSMRLATRCATLRDTACHCSLALQAGKKLGFSEARLRANVQDLASLLPDMAPDLNRMKASEWAQLLHDVNRAALVVIAMRRLYPKANVSTIVARVPRLLLQDVAALEKDARQVGLPACYGGGHECTQYFVVLLKQWQKVIPI